MAVRSRWRFQAPSRTYTSCEGTWLNDGVIVWSKLPGVFEHVKSALFKSRCFDSSPVYSSFVELQDGCPFLPLIDYDWHRYITEDSYKGPFKYSIYAIVYSVTVNFIITVFLTVIVFINIPTKPSRKASYILKLGALLASMNLWIGVARVSKKTADTYTRYGYVSSNAFLNLLWDDKAFAIIDLVVVFLLQISQLQIVMRFFDRMLERRLVFYFGLFLILLTQLLWVIPTFSPTNENGMDSDIDILPPFVYLFRITLATCYASVVCFHISVKRHVCFRGRMIFLTVLTIATVLLHPAFFIIDVSNVWIDDLSEIFNTTCYLASTVIVLEWTNRTHTMERKIQASSILGRPIYEDEEQNFHFAIYALRMQNAMNSYKIHGNNGENHSVNDEYESINNYNNSNYDDNDHYDDDGGDDGESGSYGGNNGDSIMGNRVEHHDNIERTAHLQDAKGMETVINNNVLSNLSSSSRRSSVSAPTRYDISIIHSQQGEANITQFKRPETFWNKCHHVLDSIIYYADNIMVNGLAGPKTFDSSNDSSDRMYKVERVRKTIGLDEPENVYFYRKVNVSSGSESVDTELQAQDYSQVGPSNPMPSSSSSYPHN